MTSSNNAQQINGRFAKSKTHLVKARIASSTLFENGNDRSEIILANR